MQTLAQLRSQMLRYGVTRLLMKPLSPNDNSKNQVYLDGDLGVANVIPSQAPKAAITPKNHEQIFKAAVSFSWLDENGQRYPAPRAQLILYPQYPEVRFSGFLLGAKWRPSEIMASRAPGRILILGITSTGEVIGCAANAESALARELAATADLQQEGVFRVIPLSSERVDSRALLLAALCRVARLGWIEPWRLDRDGSRLPCKGTNCGGVTLESELGISANGRSEPDLFGWEIKGHTVRRLDRPGAGVITLLTPEPTGGFYKTEGGEAFVRKYGYADLKGREDRLNFGGRHKVGKLAKRTGLLLRLDGFDAESGSLTNVFGALQLVDPLGAIAAEWSFAGILDHWMRKHSKAAYVPLVRSKSEPRQFRYGDRVLLAEGTDYLRLLAALATGKVYLDPGVKLESASTDPKFKPRNQFRTNVKILKELYHTTTEHVSCE